MEANNKIIKFALNNKSIDCATRSIKAVAHPLRLKILCLLAGREVNVHDITNSIGTSRSNISQHLSLFRGKGVLISRKSANQVFYRIDDVRVLQIISLMREAYNY